MKHPHAELIKQWADWAEVEYREFNWIKKTWSEWKPQHHNYGWQVEHYEYRLKEKNV